ncbi:DNA adenine methylase [Macrococcus armenti]|uniref:DNA adenine methylase n=1 Tax=Macrococcus armenti TaxID=2875764 RepID=UPI001CCA09FC|nr:DNA adenine methylase [Macrococcus armenti]UBH09691.1 DNA adenine methylase [Macrococcus armenti]UBH11986.1 DNA adenine methylase [Macrococcus armenti]
MKEYFEIKNRRYLGGKQKLLKFIEAVIEENTVNVTSYADIFGGTGVVADMFYQKGNRLIVNDLLFSNYICYQCFFSMESYNKNKVFNYINYLNEIDQVKGYVTKNFGNKYFSEENAGKIDAIRETIEKIDDINTREKCILLTSLLYAMDKVANTVGHYDAYRKVMDSKKRIVLKYPKINNHIISTSLYNEDANEVIKKISADLVYIDPPYNSRGYENTYHVIENIIEWKKPKVEGISMKAVNRKEKTSKYTKKDAPHAFNELIKNIEAKYILVSFNNTEQKANSRSNAKISKEQILSILNEKGNVKVYEKNFNNFTTGKSHSINHKEMLYLCEVTNE